MSMDIKLRKAQISKIIQFVGFLGTWLCKLGERVVKDLAFPFIKNDLTGLISNIASNAASTAVNKFEKRISGKETV